MESLRGHFVKCNNVNCSRLFTIDENVGLGELGLLCPICRKKAENNHVVVCGSCQTVLNFIKPEPNEKIIVYKVEKCSHCVGDIEDEREFEEIFFYDNFI